MKRVVFRALIATAVMLSGCLTGAEWSAADRSAEENRRLAGRRDRGQSTGNWWTADSANRHDSQSPWDYKLFFESVVLSPDGRYLVSGVPVPGPNAGWKRQGLVLTMLELDTGLITRFDTLFNVRRINFSADGTLAYVLNEDGNKVHVLDLVSLTLLAPAIPMGNFDFDSLDVSADGRFVVASHTPTSDFLETVWQVTKCWGDNCKLAIADVQEAAVAHVVLAHPPRDLDFSPFRNELVATTSTHLPDGSPIATLTFIDLLSGEVLHKTEFPNCADELVLQPGGSLALMAPVECKVGGGTVISAVRETGEDLGECVPPPTPEPASYDPISVLDLNTREFLGNLPGYGPVDISPDGTLAIGFTRRQDMAKFWNYQQSQKVGLIQVDLQTLDWEVIEYGSREPGYWIAPDNHSLYTYEAGSVCVDADGDPCTDDVKCTEVPANSQKFDLLTGEREQLSKPLRLDRFAVTPDGTKVIVVDNGRLAHFTVGSSWVFGTPDRVLADRLAIRPQGDFIVAARRYQTTFQLIALPSLSLMDAFTLETPPLSPVF